ncbi:LuxR family transcriptional regulator, maltose regulon positive regulatory protein [Micromonospora coriariae]|uniref:LuxR family transcriptional regulator, maltose regulon positive regulatory protein n=1 Tax=Micromonospora coriariae TaxID=285665 RepID=A0A1C4WRC5_9ACTN|nr:LuxR C-terminal-related transcriptional regulator [Micromonospora coriariae]SCE98742.1 LuxR family transcriptional regulator, maltose regulon positive regulatory protein [Micromonospora coriariae]
MPEEQDRARVSTAPGHPGDPPLLASRLTPAVPPEPVVARPRLLRRLDEGSAGPVTLVAAPAGWGKTTLLASWVRLAGGTEAGPGPAWVSVETGDDGDRLWAYLAAALRAATGPTGDDPAAPVPDRPPRPDQLELLAAALAARDRPVLLILDDLHRVADPAALTGLEFLLRHAEQRLHVVVGARAGLPLALHRLRLAGELTEIGPDELAFTDDEVADLLTAHGAPLPAAALRRLRARTGGWPAALRIAALALRGQPDPERWVRQFGGDQPEIAGYLQEEVLAAIDPADRDLLRRTALAETVCADLAEALTGRTDAGRALADLAGAGGLLHREESRPPWYRCDPLLADLLRAELARLPADELRELHARAADWYAGDGRPIDGLRHALAAGRWDRAGDLFVAHWPELTRYDADPLTGPAPASPPPEVVRADPEVALACAAERAYAGDLPAATGHLRAAAGYADGLPVPRRDRFLRLATALELTLARLAGDPPEVRAAAARLLRTRPAGVAPTGVPGATRTGGSAAAPNHALAPGTGSAAEDADVRAFTGTALGLVELAAGALPDARFVRARAAAREAGRPRTELVDASRSALLLAVRGDLRAAEQAARDALGMAPSRGWSCRLDCAYAHLALAVVALHRDQPEEAAANLALAAPATGPASSVGADSGDDWSAEPPAEPVAAAVAALCRAYLHRDAGDPAAGQRLLVRARESLTERPAAAGLANLLRAAEADLRAERGDLDTARDLLAGVADDVADPALAVTLARVELRSGDVGAAGRALPDWQAPPAESWPLPVRLDAGLLGAVLAERGGDGRRAGRILEQVLDLAGPQGCRRVFTRAEPPVRDLLAAHLDAGTAHFSLVSDLVRGAEQTTARQPAEPAGTLDEPLTERELTILRYLQSILSNVEIASELSLSVNTVKTHVRNIYRKLDATRRREAVRRARELRLI